MTVAIVLVGMVSLIVEQSVAARQPYVFLRHPRGSGGAFSLSRAATDATEAGLGVSSQLSAHCAKMTRSVRDFVGSLQAA